MSAPTLHFYQTARVWGNCKYKEKDNSLFMQVLIRKNDASQEKGHKKAVTRTAGVQVMFNPYQKFRKSKFI